jgi:hypothetical protein
VSDGKHDVRGDPRRPGAARRMVAGALARLSFANVAAALALFVALGGTATAVTLARDSVGSPQIKADAVRSPEIRAEAVRSSEIRDESIRLADIAPDARTALDAPRVRFAEDDEADARRCEGPLTSCSNLLSVTLPSGSWLVQAKFVARNEGAALIAFPFCGLVRGGTTVLDEAVIEPGRGEAALLTDVLTDLPATTRVALRCTTQPPSASLVVENIKLTALEVGTVTGP